MLRKAKKQYYSARIVQQSGDVKQENASLVAAVDTDPQWGTLISRKRLLEEQRSDGLGHLAEVQLSGRSSAT
ncbi:hypothetical protein MTO96_028184 [Rhipicephalus appendiculatus]